MPSSGELFRQTAQKLLSLYGEQESKSISFLLFEAVFQLSRTDILADRPVVVNTDQRNNLENYIFRLLQEEPLQYILGETFFYGYSFTVNPSVLIPRPETEELVQKIIRENRQQPALSILDIGTGSGCISVSLKKQIPQAKVFALDVSPQALEVARMNAERNQAEIFFMQGDILAAETKLPQVSLIVSNPPYVKQEEKKDMRRNVWQYEPHLALFVEDHDPLLFYRTIIEKAVQSLLPQGKLYFEINEQYGNETASMMNLAGFIDVDIVKDLSGKERIVSGMIK